MKPGTKLLVFQHVACEHPGSLRGRLERDGIEWDVVQLDTGAEIPELESYDVLWVMGGPMDVWDEEEYPWLLEEKEAIRHWVRGMRRPFLGFCLGHQLLADALGGSCAPQRPAEIGVLEVETSAEGRRDRLFAGLPPRQRVLQWHSVCVERVPEDGVALAHSDVCAVQAMRIGECAWSMQYHVEVEADTIANWGEIPVYRSALENALGPGSLERLRDEAGACMEEFAANSEILYRSFGKCVAGHHSP